MEKNGKKMSRFQFHFTGLLGTSSMSKQETKKNILLDIGDNPIYPFWEADGQDLEYFLKCQKLHF